MTTNTLKGHTAAKAEVSPPDADHVSESTYPFGAAVTRRELEAVLSSLGLLRSDEAFTRLRRVLEPRYESGDERAARLQNERTERARLETQARMEAEAKAAAARPKTEKELRDEAARSYRNACSPNPGSALASQNLPGAGQAGTKY